MRFAIFAAVSITTALALVSHAEAATVTETVNFTADNFTSSGGPVPNAPVHGSITFRFDDTKEYLVDPNVVVSSSFDIPFTTSPSQLYFSLDRSFGETLIIISSVNVGTITSGDGIELAFSPSTKLFNYVRDGFPGKFSSSDVAIQTSVAATPLPASALMLLTGLAGVGGLVVFRQRQAVPRCAANGSFSLLIFFPGTIGRSPKGGGGFRVSGT